MGSLGKDIDMIELLGAEGFEPRSTGGGRFNMICPLHGDTKPSFIIYPNNTWHCFGCQRGGDSISFIRELHNLGFKKALEYLDIKFQRVKKIVRKPDMIEEVAAEERRGVDVLTKYGADLINLLLTAKLRQEVQKHGNDGV